MNITTKFKLPPGPKGKISIGNLFHFRRDSLAFLKKIADRYGDIVHFRIGPIAVLLLNHPDFIKEVLSKQHHNFIKGRPLEMAKKILGEGLLTSEGEFHDRQSRLIQPIFHKKMLESYAPAMTACTARLTSYWEDGMQIDIMKEMMKLSTAIAGKTLFGSDLEQKAPEINEALIAASSLFDRISIPFSEWLLKIPIPSSIKFFKAKARLDNTIDNLIQDRRKNQLNNGDLLSVLINAQDPGITNNCISDQQVHDEALTLFLTAFDTTSIALTWSWYLLSQNPEAEQKLYREVDSVLKGRTPTVEDISMLRYTRMVMGESMRMYPPIYLITREATDEFAISDYVVPAGTLILISPYLIHHDSRFHVEPEKFNPLQWDKNSRGENAKYQYFPFGGGPRSCIGQSFAWLEGVLVLAAIAQSWGLKLVSNHPVILQQLVNLRPKHGMLMSLQRR